MRPFILKRSISRQKRAEKAKPCEEMEASRGREAVEVRRIHIVYFLSRNGKIEQPHLIRIHHLNRNGVHLRDVKRWLSELRGSEMPDSFSWSFKRSYKAGYVWQDLNDDELITPFSDNEYIVKGSLLPSVQHKTVEDFLPFYQRNISSTRKQHIEEEEEEEDEDYEQTATPSTYMPIPKTPHETLPIDENISPKPPPRGDEESPIGPATSTSSFEENRKQTGTFKMESGKEEMKRGEEQSYNEVAINNSGSKVFRSNSKGRSEAGRRRRMAADCLRNLLRCRLVDAKDSVMGAGRRRDGSIPQNNQRSSSRNERKSWEKKGSKGSRKGTERAASAKYKPATEPNCSQCGKPFKPEKLHSHMKSCIALKEKGRSMSFNRDGQTARTAASSTKKPSKVTVTVL